MSSKGEDLKRICAARRRSPATLSSFHQGRTPANTGLRYPPDPASVAETTAVKRACGSCPESVRLRASIVVLWCAHPRISEALALTESDLDRRRGAGLGWAGKGGKGRQVGMDCWAWEQLNPWLELCAGLPVGAWSWCDANGRRNPGRRGSMVHGGADSG